MIHLYIISFYIITSSIILFNIKNTYFFVIVELFYANNGLTLTIRLVTSITLQVPAFCLLQLNSFKQCLEIAGAKTLKKRRTYKKGARSVSVNLFRFRRSILLAFKQSGTLNKFSITHVVITSLYDLYKQRRPILHILREYLEKIAVLIVVY